MAASSSFNARRNHFHSRSAIMRLAMKQLVPACRAICEEVLSKRCLARAPPKARKVDPSTLDEWNALSVEQRFLERAASFSGETHASTRAQHAVPRQALVGRVCMERIAHHPRVSRESGQHRDLSIRRDASPGNACDDAIDPLVLVCFLVAGTGFVRQGRAGTNHGMWIRRARMAAFRSLVAPSLAREWFAGAHGWPTLI